MSGKVPNPNSTMYGAASGTDGMLIAPAKAKYTKPQGNNPFKNPTLPRAQMPFC